MRPSEPTSTDLSPLSLTTKREKTEKNPLQQQTHSQLNSIGAGKSPRTYGTQESVRSPHMQPAQAGGGGDAVEAVDPRVQELRDDEDDIQRRRREADEALEAAYYKNSNR
eukprot:Rhum_TRINITY_DN12217_c0_g1::Rhum_TRINITY_DN12217_c0_g1_i1::g.50194::m.50194